MDGKAPTEDDNKDPKALEETYQRLYMKMGRDFIHVDDFFEVIENIIEIIDPDKSHNIQARMNSGVMTKAAFYKKLIDSGDSADMQPFDLIDLTED